MTVFSQKKKITNPYIFVRSERKIVKIALNDIYFIEACGEHIVVHTEHEKRNIQYKLGEMQSMLNKAYFIRVHRSYIVHIEKIRSIEPERIQLTNNLKIPVGRTYKSQFIQQLHII